MRYMTIEHHTNCAGRLRLDRAGDVGIKGTASGIVHKPGTARENAHAEAPRVAVVAGVKRGSEPKGCAD